MVKMAQVALQFSLHVFSTRMGLGSIPSPGAVCVFGFQSMLAFEGIPRVLQFPSCIVKILSEYFILVGPAMFAATFNLVTRVGL